jgi:hypothetical protein
MENAFNSPRPPLKLFDFKALATPDSLQPVFEVVDFRTRDFDGLCHPPRLQAISTRVGFPPTGFDVFVLLNPRPWERPQELRSSISLSRVS